mmetsp:Transcript_3268/g.6034  ORF Transcript_3268/g.6034 Transcript_3268/m.6034 type:complete len:175 (-) Transcript_3268:25-549(-)
MPVVRGNRVPVRVPADQNVRPQAAAHHVQRAVVTPRDGLVAVHQADAKLADFDYLGLGAGGGGGVLVRGDVVVHVAEDAVDVGGERAELLVDAGAAGAKVSGAQDVLHFVRDQHPLEFLRDSRGAVGDVEVPYHQTEFAETIRHYMLLLLQNQSGHSMVSRSGGGKTSSDDRNC